MSPIAQSIGGGNFWGQVEKERNAKGYTFFKDGSLHYTIFDDRVKMEPFVRTTEIMFSARAVNASINNGYIVLINAQFYDLNARGYFDYGIGDDPVDPAGILPEGVAVLGNKIVAGRSSPLCFFIANVITASTKYQFGFGAAPTHADGAIGGAGPIIVNGLPYGKTNLYATGKPQGRPIGEPSKVNAKNLIQRSNATYGSFMEHDSAPRTGMTVIAHHSQKKKLGVFVKPDNSSGLTLGSLKSKLIKADFDNAIFLDGSNSSMLMVEGVFYSKAAASKNKTNVVGIGFKY